jgi:hypothetical protein
VRGVDISWVSGSVERFPEPMWLATLGNPHPEQFRFRLLGGDDRPLPDGPAKTIQAGYVKGRRLGRSFYWSQAHQPPGYWKPDLDHTLVAGQEGALGYAPQVVEDHFREYLAPLGTKRKVTSAVSGWIAPDSTFSVTLRVENVEPALLGVLLWLLTRPDITFGLGHGKPLGFGAATVTADLDEAALSTGAQVRESYGAWGAAPPTADAATLTRLIADAEGHLDASITAPFLALGAGRPGLAVHYPRPTTQPTATSYEWFTQNERPQGPRRRSLPSPIAASPTLPYWPVE